MKRNLSLVKWALCLTVLAPSALNAQSPTIQVVPSAPSAAVGQPFQVAVRVMGLGSGAPSSLGGFAVVLAFDDSLFTFDSIDFGLDLGDPNAAEVLPSNMVSGGNLTATAVSLLPASTLNGSQGSSVTLFTASFTASVTGTGTFDLVPLAPLADENGAPIVTPAVVPATVVAGGPLAIPAAGPTALLSIALLIGLAGLMVLRRAN